MLHDGVEGCNFAIDQILSCGNRFGHTTDQLFPSGVDSVDNFRQSMGESNFRVAVIGIKKFLNVAFRKDVRSHTPKARWLQLRPLELTIR